MGWESITPRAKMYYLKQYYLRGPFDRLLKRKVRIDKEFAEAVYKCTSCGHCQTVCPVDIPFQKRWDEIKEWLVDRGVADFPEHREVYENVLREHNIYGEPHEKRGAWIPEEARISDSPEVVFWVGCAQSYRQRQVARAVVKILNAARVKYTILGKDEWCTGAPLMRMGFVRYVRAELAPHNVEEVAKTGAKTLVTACAECFRAFWRDYREMIGNPPFSVYHISHYVEKLVKEKRLKLTKPLPKVVTMHDACHLGRNCGVYEEPRRAMRTIPQVKLVEMSRNEDETLCSGASGGFNLIWQKEASHIARRRLEEAVKTGAEIMVTTCPHAEEHMKEVARRANIPIKTMDLAEVIADAIVVEEKAAVPEAQSQR
jgi:heterodisulfide reductase subunit D